MQKYTVKLILWKHNPNPQGLLPVYIKITINRKTSYISTGIVIHPKYWDEKTEQVKEGHQMAHLYNPDLTDRKSKIVRKIVDAHIKGIAISASELKGNQGIKTGTNIFDFKEQFVKDVKHKREPATIENYRKHLKKLELFHGNKLLNFEDINMAYLQRYENHLRETIGANYTHALFKTLKTFFNAAKKRGLISNYPFTLYENPVYKAPTKDYLNLDELSRWEAFADETTNKVLKQTAVYFLLGCYSGLRISDWRIFNPKTHVVNNRLKLYAKKNGEIVTMPISKPLRRTLDRVAIVALDIEEPTINEKLKVIAAKLQIPKRLTTHTGRHTFAITICAEQGISAEVCATLMGITIKTCLENYYRVTGIKIDNETLGAWKGLK